jgi:cytochrome c oxidase subunit III
VKVTIPFAVAPRPDTGLNNSRLGLWLFLASEAMLFGGLISAYVFLRTGAPAWAQEQEKPELSLALINTVLLLVSSVTIVLSVKSLQEGKFAQARRFLGSTVLLGAAFIAVKWFSYSIQLSNGFYPSSSTFLGIYFALTGLHLVHLLGGILLTILLLATSRNIWESAISRVSGAALYWNFVDLVWIVIFLLFYVV